MEQEHITFTFQPPHKVLQLEEKKITHKIVYREREMQVTVITLGNYSNCFLSFFRQNFISFTNAKRVV